MPTDCLTSLLGLSKGSQCFPLPTDPDAAAAIRDSSTGLWLDMAEGLRLQPASGSTAATDLYERMAAARALAVVQVRTMLTMGAGIPLYSKRGTLGGLGNGQLSPVGTRALMRFYTNARREGAWRITKLQLFTDQVVTDAPLLLDGEEKGRLSSDAQGRTSGLPATGLLIPLDGNEHELEVLLPEGVRVRANNFFAGCFSCQRGTPWFVSVQHNLQNVSAQTPGNGFAISVEEECTAEPDFLCFAVGSDRTDADGKPVFRYPQLAQALGLALLYKSAELFTTGLLANQQLNRYTMLEPKALAELRDYYGSKLNTMSPDGTGNYIGWLNSPEGLGQVQHPCYLRPPARGMGTQWTG